MARSETEPADRELTVQYNVSLGVKEIADGTRLYVLASEAMQESNPLYELRRKELTIIWRISLWLLILLGTLILSGIILTGLGAVTEQFGGVLLGTAKSISYVLGLVFLAGFASEIAGPRLRKALRLTKDERR